MSTKYVFKFIDGEDEVDRRSFSEDTTVSGMIASLTVVCREHNFTEIALDDNDGAHILRAICDSNHRHYISSYAEDWTGYIVDQALFIECPMFKLHGNALSICYSLVAIADTMYHAYNSGEYHGYQES